jgi:hypothetical protein
MSCFCGTPFTPVSASWLLNAGSNRRLEFELGAWFEGFCGFALVLALSQMMEHGLTRVASSTSGHAKKQIPISNP